MLEPSLRSRSVFNIVPISLLIIGGAILYRSCLNGDFLADDFGYIQLYSRTKLSQFPSLFVNDWSQGIWGSNLGELRPLVGFAYWLEYRLWGVNPLGYHLTNLSLYLLTLVGFYCVVRETARALLERSVAKTAIGWIGVAAAILFLVHPAHVEATVWIAGRTDLLASCAWLWSLYCLLRFWQTGSSALWICAIVIYAAGLFMKESVVTMPGAFVFYAGLEGSFISRWKRVVATLPPLAGVMWLWITLRRKAFGAIGNVNFEELSGRLTYYSAQFLPVQGKIALTILITFLFLCLIWSAIAWSRSGRFVLFWSFVWTALHLLPLSAVHYENSRHIFLLVGGPLVLLPAASALAWKKHWLAGMTLLTLGAGLMFGLLKPTLKSLSEWERSARYSRQLSVLLIQNDYPANSIVVFNSLPGVSTLHRHWSLPFAMEPPFVNLRARYVSVWNWYCCDKPFLDSRVFLKELEAGVPQQIYRIDFDAVQDRYISTEASGCGRTSLTGIYEDIRHCK